MVLFQLDWMGTFAFHPDSYIELETIPSPLGSFYFFLRRPRLPSHFCILQCAFSHIIGGDEDILVIGLCCVVLPGFTLREVHLNYTLHDDIFFMVVFYVCSAC